MMNKSDSSKFPPPKLEAKDSSSSGEKSQSSILGDLPTHSNPKFHKQGSTASLTSSQSLRFAERPSSITPTNDPDEVIDQAILNSLNVEQAKANNLKNLDKLGGVEELARKLGVSIVNGWDYAQAVTIRKKFGTNEFPETPMEGFFSLLMNAFNDFILLILIFAACVSIGIGTWQEPDHGYIEGVAILAAVFVVALVTAGNNYSKELQFRALEKSSQKEERTSVVRDGQVVRINPKEIIVGDILKLQAGDMIPADSIICDNNTVMCNESNLTGEPVDVRKTRSKDCFLLSSTVITEGEEVRALVTGIGMHSQWGRIKQNLVTESVNTPLQDKLEAMAKQIGLVGLTAAVCTFIALIINIWARDNGENVSQSVISAFILAVVIIVVAIPEGLPLAVTIALAYSTKKMYKDQCFIRILAACETMGNATNICSDKTGTLTENTMTVVEGWFAGRAFSQDTFSRVETDVSETSKSLIVENVSVNRLAYILFNDSDGKPLYKPNIIGSKTEGALLLMVKSWGVDCELEKLRIFNESRDKIYAFNSNIKRSQAVIKLKDGRMRLYCKGAAEIILKDCTFYLNSDGSVLPMTEAVRSELDTYIRKSARAALRMLLLAHRDYSSITDLPADWRDAAPAPKDMCCDCVVGIIDPLRADVYDAVRVAQEAGVTVRMCTGDNPETAAAIAKQCGILTENGLVMEGPDFRELTPAAVDAILPRLQVLARSSPNDKFLLVTRLNGNTLPKNEKDWLTNHKKRGNVSWERDRDKYLPGYYEEWKATRPYGGEVVGVTGDGTNDAPALKAADVGLAMGITGTKVAQGASDIVILDDKFSSIVMAILWGRSIYDSVRKFLQFQLTVNIVALVLEFVGAVSGFGQPLTAVMMLWLNLVMDTMGALALATEPPNRELLQRRPYRRNCSLISRPMRRNIAAQALFQLTLLFFLLFYGPTLFDIHPNGWCEKYTVSSSGTCWDVSQGTGKSSNCSSPFAVKCSTFSQICDGEGICYEGINTKSFNSVSYNFRFIKLKDFETECLTCKTYDLKHATVIFNTFVFCQIFNEVSSRELFDRKNFFRGILKNPIFMGVLCFSVGIQIFLVEIGGEFVGATPVSIILWLQTIGFAAITVVVGFLMRFFPVKEHPNDFFYSSMAVEGITFPNKNQNLTTLKTTPFSDETTRSTESPDKNLYDKLPSRRLPF